MRYIFRNCPGDNLTYIMSHAEDKLDCVSAANLGAYIIIRLCFIELIVLCLYKSSEKMYKSRIVLISRFLIRHSAMRDVATAECCYVIRPSIMSACSRSVSFGC